MMNVIADWGIVGIIALGGAGFLLALVELRHIAQENHDNDRAVQALWAALYGHNEKTPLHHRHEAYDIVLRQTPDETLPGLTITLDDLLSNEAACLAAKTKAKAGKKGRK